MLGVAFVALVFPFDALNKAAGQPPCRPFFCGEVTRVQTAFVAVPAG